MDPFPVLLSVQVPKQFWWHERRSTSWTWIGSQEHLIKLTVALKKYSEWHLKYHKDKKAWCRHTNTGTVTLISVLQHIRSSSEANLGSPCPSRGCLPVPQVCWSNCLYVELKIGLTKAIGVKTMLERKGSQKGIEDLKENSVWEYLL